MAAHKPYFACLLLSHDACQIRCAKSSVKRANLRAGLSKDGIFRGNGQVAHQVQHVSAPNGITVNHGNDGFWQRANLLLHIKHIEAGHTVTAHIAAASFHVHVTTRAKCLVASSGQHHHANVLCLAAIAQGIAHFGHSQWGKGVAVARSVNGNACNAVVGIKQYFLVFFNSCPISHINICLGECTLKACCRNAVALFKIAPPRQRGRLWHS